LKIQLKNKKLLIFDFDGTIVDSSPIHRKSFKEALYSYGLTVNYEMIKGMRTEDAILKIFDINKQSISNERLKKLISKKQSLSQNFFTNISLIEGFYEFYQYARSIYKLAIVSSASRISIDLALKKFELENGFDLILSSESVDNAKPNPEGFLKAVDSLGVSQSDALIFEDSVAGFLAAENAGIDCIDITKRSWGDLMIEI
jgi:beta-phosphoglucomutase